MCPCPSRAGWRYDLTDEEAIDLGQRAIYHATHRDAMSGGINNLYIVKPDGWKKVRRHARAFPPAAIFFVCRSPCPLIHIAAALLR